MLMVVVAGVSPYNNTNDSKEELVELNAELKGEVQLDVYVATLRIAFEYNGAQHYQYTTLFGTPDKQKANDKRKQEWCAKQGTRSGACVRVFLC